MVSEGFVVLTTSARLKLVEMFLLVDAVDFVSDEKKLRECVHDFWLQEIELNSKHLFAPSKCWASAVYT